MRGSRSLELLFVMLTFVAGASAQSYQVVTVNDGGTIRGMVKWSGEKPKLAPVPINKDPQVCDPQSQKVRDLERLIISAQGGVANTVVFLKEISAGKAMNLPAQLRFLDQRNCRYEPHILLVPSGEVLQMKSSDTTLHTVHMDGAASYNLPFPFPNQVISRQMATSGVVNMRCNGGHTWMNAEMFVVPHPYYAVTDESGRFELTDIPAGNYQLVAWHEGWNVARKEGSFDVLTERRVERPVFSPPRTWEKSVKVDNSTTSTVTFLISEK
jgi:hypothetical protein